jgi:hypothetical protein
LRLKEFERHCYQMFHKDKEKLLREKKRKKMKRLNILS